LLEIGKRGNFKRSNRKYLKFVKEPGYMPPALFYYKTNPDNRVTKYSFPPPKLCYNISIIRRIVSFTCGIRINE